MQSRVDILVDDNGDLVVGDDGDLTLATCLQTVEQDVKFRGLTAHHDYGPDPFIGADLPKYRRRMNNRRNGDFMKADLYEALTRDGRFERGSVVVDAVPVSRTEVAMPVFIRDYIQGMEDEILDTNLIQITTFVVDMETGEVSTITGGLA